MRAIQMSEFGGPEVLELVELPTPEPEAGEALIRVTRAGINFADTHTRTNSYVQKATLPLMPGGEVAGVPQPARGRAAARGGAHRRRRLRRVCDRAGRALLPDPRRSRRRHAVAMLIQG